MKKLVSIVSSFGVLFVSSAVHSPYAYADMIPPGGLGGGRGGYEPYQLKYCQRFASELPVFDRVLCVYHNNIVLFAGVAVALVAGISILALIFLRRRKNVS